MSEWKEVKLGEISSYGKERISVASLNSATYISTENMQPNRGGVVLASSIPDVGGVIAYKKDDILVSNIRPYFKKIWQASHDGGCSADVLVFRNRENVDAKFLYYLLSADSFFDYSMATAKGTKMPRGDKNSLMEYEVKLPPLAEQCRIAEILSSLDDKIELNNAINRNLEEQAQAIFKNWFIDFAPFGGVMPGDWKETTLGNVCLKVTDGSHFSPQDDPTAPYPMYSVKDMETYGFNSNNCKHISAEDFEKMKAGDCVPRADDILVAKDGSYLKEIFICSEEREEAILSSIAIFRPDKKKILPEILLFLLKQPSVRKDVADNFVSGSALPRIVLKDFKKYQFILPSINAQQDLAKILNSIRKQIQNNVDENQRLTTLRDTLLPKLMSDKSAKAAAV